MLPHFIEACKHSFMHSSLMILPQHLRQVEVCTLSHCGTSNLFILSHSVVDLLL